MSRPARLVLAVAACTLAAAAAAIGAGVHSLLQPGPPLPAAVTITVGEGERFTDIAADLARQGVLRHPLPLVVWARFTGRDRHVHWGEYFLTTSLSPLELLERLNGPPDPVHAITIPEGLTTAQVVDLLATAGFGSDESFDCLLEDPAFLAAHDLPPDGAEGYLFPDTYTFPLAMPQERILRTMLERFRDVTGPDFARRAAALGFSEQEAVTLASLIEEETGRADERRVVAGVFVNRLRRGMPLQSDPTVLYGRDRGRPGSSRALSRADLRRPTPFNTYTIPGLPPAPIANPGRAALEAAIDPAPVEYLYFVARGDGSHEFSTTLTAHNRAVDRYIRSTTPPRNGPAANVTRR